ncbi:MAG TPA: hypothetical protein VFR90_02205 [Methylibium sp.]|uniref:hypothetical protein n=1 Tax=Methylibium sp. TaxID=2067992 RepID=UPI002DB7E208|nr:hypothetical protein [Methylibium sp.]HEU4457914.1 hypothetical protein [Methylibium sp.]
MAANLGFPAALLAFALAGVASAQTTVYRCGTDGRSYSQQPCGDGRALDFDDARSDAQRRDAQAASHREALVAQQLERDRRRIERAGGPSVARIDGRGGGHEAAAPSKAATTRPRKAAPEASFKAAVPRQPKPRKA